MNTAIIVAAGSGSRFRSGTPKQFIELSGRPVIVRTVERFERCPVIDEIIVVLAPDRIEWFTNEAGRFGFSKLKHIIRGGKIRAESVRNGLNAASESTDVVAVHDGARPLVSTEEITETVRRAEETGAACLTASVVDTIKHVEGGFISGTLDRTRLRRALTPQAFRFDILRKAFDGADLSETMTDECYLVEKLGIPIAAVDGSSMNIKITQPEDLALAEFYLGSERES